MKKLSVIVILSIFVLVAASGVFAKDLRVVGSWSSLTMFKNFEKPFWTEKLPSVMPDVKAEVTSLGQVKLKGPAVLRQMNMGVFDVVHTVADYVVADSPILAGLDMPALAPQIDQARKVVDAYRPVVAKALADDFNAKLLAIAPYPAQVIFCRDEISGLDDLKGKKIRASGWTTSEFVTALGATGVTMSFSEVPQSLQRGVVDCAITGSLSGYSAGWGEVANYVYPLPVGGWDYVITSMNMKTWDSFSPADQNTLQQAITNDLEAPAWNVTAKETQDGIACLTGNAACDHGKPNSLTLVPISENDLSRARKVLVENVLPAWAEKVGPDVVKEWNDTAGREANVKAQ
ncbi:MAG: TRAP transporter substrate-binding protein [Desulfuromonadales bacterium]|nr:TRAP transporter substrate-binding protein [Desulfuromonadales bacterium]MBN2793548.1 TRAP transporter substrate-binding protein [Desulfuromonadales bacterium]